MAVKSVSDVMRQRFLHVSPDTSLQEAFDLMEITRLRHLLVVEDQRPVGIVSHEDLRIVRDELLGTCADGDGAEQLETTSVEVVMNVAPEAIRPTCSLAEAENRLLSERVRVIPVTTEGDCAERLVGIVTGRDIFRGTHS